MNGNKSDCNSIKYLGTEIQGGLAQFITIPEENCIVLPKSVLLDIASLAYPVFLILDSVERALIKKDSRLIILGTDWLSLLSYLTLSHFHDGEVILATSDESNKHPDSGYRSKKLTKEQVAKYLNDGSHFISGFSYDSFSEIVSKKGYAKLIDYNFEKGSEAAFFD